MYTPNSILEYNIYDVFHNDNNKLIVVMPCEGDIFDIQYIENNESFDFVLHKCPEKHIRLYILPNEVNYSNKILLKINNTLLEAKVSKYPEFKNEIIMSTMVLNEDNYIIQWIKFYLNIGVTRFIIYDNAGINDNASYHSIENSSDLPNLLKDYIKNNIVILIKWPFYKRRPNSGASGQQTQQNHSLHAFQNCKYIGFFDIDEYLNLQKCNSIDSFLDDYIERKKININRTGSFKFWSKFFYNPEKLSTKNYDFLKIFHCAEVLTHGREKHFVIPKNITIFCIHKVLKGKFVNVIPPEDAYFNHYFYLNKHKRGLNKTDLRDESILRFLTDEMK